MILLLFLVFVLLLLAYCSHPTWRRVLQEGFGELPDFSKPSVNLAVNADFMTFVQFNQAVCTMWDEVITDIIKNDQVGVPAEQQLTKEQYVAKLEQGFLTKISLVKCIPFDPTSTLSVLLAAVPESPQVYKDTFLFLNKELTDALKKLHDALDSANVSVSAFADYEPFEDCSAAVAAATAAATTAATAAPSVQNLQAEQLKQTNQLLARINSCMVEMPALQSGLQSVNAKYSELKSYKTKSESGDIYNEVT